MKDLDDRNCCTLYGCKALVGILVGKFRSSCCWQFYNQIYMSYFSCIPTKLTGNVDDLVLHCTNKDILELDFPSPTSASRVMQKCDVHNLQSVPTGPRTRGIEVTRSFQQNQQPESIDLCC